MRALTLALCLALSAPVAGCSTTQSAGTQLDDSVITSKVNAKLTTDRDVNKRDVGVQTDEGVVTLTGRVQTAQEKAEAEDLARSVSGVKQVRNLIKTGDGR